MNLNRSRSITTILIALVLFVALTLKEFLIQITGSRIGDYVSGRFGVSVTVLVYALIGILLILMVLTIYGAIRTNSIAEEPKTPDLGIDSFVAQFRKSLIDLYQRRYEKKLDGRLEIALEVRSDWGRQKATLIKEEFCHVANAGTAIETVTAALMERGRLLIVGNPGAGKTVLLLKLAVSLLRGSATNEAEPFPVIFNLASWSEEYRKFEDWLEATLVSGYGLSKEFAVALLHEQRIVVLLDGLDELAAREDEKVAAQKRAACLQSLNRALTRGRRVVICCRRDEFFQLKKLANQEAPVSAIVTLLDLTPQQIKSALLGAANGADRDATAARHLIDLLKQKRGRILLNALRTPYFFTTALEIFDRPILDKVSIPLKSAELEREMLHRFVERKLQDTPNPYRYEAEKIKRWLNWLAIVLFAGRRSTFELANLQAYHIQLKSNFAVANGVCAGLMMESCFVMAYGPSVWGIGFSTGALLFSLVSLMGLKRLIVTEDIRSWKLLPLFRWATWRRWIVFLVASSLTVGYLFRWLATKAQITAVSPNRTGFLGALLILGTIIIQIVIGSARVVSFYSYLQSPYQRLRAGVVPRIAEFTILGVFSGLYVRYVFHLGSAVVVFGALCLGLSSLLTTPLGRHLIVRFCLSFEKRMPLRYVRFLDYACEAGILERDGGHWRFRHQHLQYYFGTLPNYSEKPKK